MSLREQSTMCLCVLFLLLAFLANARSTETSTMIVENSTDLHNITNSTIKVPGSGRDMDWFRLQHKEIVYVISGNRNFGGHDKQLFRAPILDIVRFTGEQFNETSARFAVVWANAYITMRIVAPLLEQAKEAEFLLESFMEEIPEPFPTALSGLEGSIEFAMDNVFSSDHDVIKVMVLLTHWNMLHADVNEFLKQKCSRVVLFVLVFPWPYQPCENPKVQRMVLHMNQRLNVTGLLKNQMAFCGRRIDILEEFQPYIFDGHESFRTLVTWCDIHYPITTSTTPAPPCVWSYFDFQSLVTCHGNIMYVGLGMLIFFGISFSCAIAWISRSFVSFMADYRQDAMAKREKAKKEREHNTSLKPKFAFLSSVLRRHAQMIGATSLWSYKNQPARGKRYTKTHRASKVGYRASRRASIAQSMTSNERNDENTFVMEEAEGIEKDTSEKITEEESRNHHGEDSHSRSGLEFIEDALRAHSQIATSIWGFYAKQKNPKPKSLVGRLKKRQRSVVVVEESIAEENSTQNMESKAYKPKVRRKSLVAEQVNRVVSQRQSNMKRNLTLPESEGSINANEQHNTARRKSMASFTQNKLSVQSIAMRNMMTKSSSSGHLREAEETGEQSAQRSFRRKSKDKKEILLEKSSTAKIQRQESIELTDQATHFDL